MNQDIPRTDNQLLQALQNGDEEGAEQIFRRYYERLIRLVSKNYGKHRGASETESDIVQSVFCSFFRRGRAAEFQINDDGSLWPILVTIALNKIRNRAKYWSRQKRDTNQVVGAEELSAILSREPSPDEAAILKDVIDELMTQFSERRQRILQMLLDGHALVEIMETVGTSRFTIARTRQAAAAFLEQTVRSELDK